MKKAVLIIGFILMLLVTSTSFVYAFIKASEASKERNRADSLREQVISLEAQLDESQQRALEAAAQARMAEAEALEAMEACLNGKK